ncbi:MAG: zf-HC2 domain-containing protein [Anaerolineaceae bacterium]|jgi:predicted anti-sigma-YlaC factor YlaD|nr:zf-HC2 domain-containing protein [Anaerolineaceae bacterium]
MVHQPIEKWIIEETPLTAEQKTQLEEHLRMCKHCRDLQNSLLEVDDLLMKAEIAAPNAGFTQRFQSTLAQRKALKERRQVRKFFLSLLGAAMVTLGAMGLYIAMTSSPVEMVIRLMENSTRILINLDRFERFVTMIFNTLPPYFSVGIWAMAASGLCLFTLIWVGALWRTSLQGVFHK